jgi:cysteinyl-tRNA synthetase
LSESDYYPRFTAAMDDDFNTREAIAVIFDLVRELNSSKGKLAVCDDLAALIKGFGSVLGILEESADSFLKSGGQHAGGLSDADIDALVQERDNAKQNKDYTRADEIRDQLKEQGIGLEDGASGTQWRRA